MRELVIRKINLKSLIVNCLLAGLVVFCATNIAAAETDPACEIGIDCDNDGYYEEDNCPDVSNPGQQDVDHDGIGDACDEDTIYGYISGEFKEGIDVNIATVTCSGNDIVDILTTDEDGYYAIGDLGNRFYEVTPESYDYIFYPASAIVKVSTAL